jgi:hypothetical protein
MLASDACPACGTTMVEKRGTFSRWESGRNVQTGAMDLLLRLIRDLPGSIGYLRSRAA